MPRMVRSTGRTTTELREVTKKLIALRRGTPALHSPEWLPLAVEPATPLFAYLRTDESESESERIFSIRPVVVLLNFSGSDVEAVADLPDDTAASFGDGELTDLWSGEPVPAVAERSCDRRHPRLGMAVPYPGAWPMTPPTRVEKSRGRAVEKEPIVSSAPRLLDSSTPSKIGP